MPWYEIRVQGQIDRQWADWFAGFTISYDTDDSTILRGSIVDQAALHGVLIRVRDLSLTLLSVNQVAPGNTPARDEGT
jgi:hypothetical protein